MHMVEVDILSTVSDFHQCTVSAGNCFVACVGDINSYMSFVGLFSHTVRSGVIATVSFHKDK